MDVTIIGTGQMAVMCAVLLSDNGHKVTLVGRPPTIETIGKTRRSPQLPSFRLPAAWQYRTEVDGEPDLLVLAVPTQVTEQAMHDANLTARCTWPFVSCAKGIERTTGQRPSEIIQNVLAWPGAEAVLSGPNIAPEVVARKPAGAVVASADQATAERIRDAFATDYFRVYTSDDVVGVELAGATKNIIAIAAGIVDGLDLGNNAKAALITRGLTEMTRLGTVLGARGDTFAGLAGMGDLMTTCFSPDGRNRRLGQMIGEGQRLDEAKATLGSVAEGVPTTQAVLAMAGKHDVEMPIVRAVAAVLFEGVDPRQALVELMRRSPKTE
jgi:glycerol-3-phosphate dehydrogenase (NAD(P)+)